MAVGHACGGGGHAWGCAWQGACVVGGVHGRGEVCEAGGGMHGRGHVWWGGMHGRGCAW